MRYEFVDKKSAFITITAGVGGVDAEDWASMLFRMYYRWADGHNYYIRLLEESCGDVAGIKSATLEITGVYAYGCLKSEQGTHVKIVRISPENGNGKRLTCKASVEVSPILDKPFELEIPEKDLAITKWLCNGRNINRPETWVRMLHIPTGITAVSSEQRNQLQNQEQALAIIKSKLWALMQTQGVKDVAGIQFGKIKSLFKKPIREYILHPYTRVKDLRTQVETTSATAVLNGDIDLFIKAYLQKQYEILE